MCSYLKKTKMLKLAKNLYNIDFDVKLSDCDYRFYSGHESLIFTDDTYVYDLRLSLDCNLVWVKKYYYSELDDSKVSVIDAVYSDLNSFLVAV